MWARWRPWVVAAIVVTLFALAIRIVEGELSHLRHHDIVDAVSRVPANRILLAIALTIVSYATLVGYDFLALVYAKHRLPIHRIAFGSVVTYGISLTLGFPAITGGSIRVRLWSAWGLGTTEIAQAVAFAGLTFTIGVVALTGAVGLLEPSENLARIHLPIVAIRWIAAVCVILTAAYVARTLRARGGEFRIKGLVVPAPTPYLVAAQFALAAVDWIIAAGVLYVLLPAGSDVHFPAFVAAFLLAQTAGLLSHVPGGLGVFESIMLLQVAGTAPPEDLVASLVLFRAVYYLIPFVAASAMLVVREVRAQHSALVRSASVIVDGLGRWTEPLLPAAVGTTTFIGGAVLLVSGATPSAHTRLAALVDVLPLGVVELSHFAGSIVGAALLVVGWALSRRLDSGYHMARGLLVIGIVASLLKGLDWEEATALAVVLTLLTASRGAFYRKSSLFAEPLTPGWIAAIAVIVSASIWIGMFSFKHVEYTNELWWRFAERGDAPRFLRGSAGAAVLLVVLGSLRLMRGARHQIAPTTVETIARVEALIPKIDESSAALALIGDKHIMMSEGGDGFLMFGVSGRSWIVLGDPFGPDATSRELAWDFVEEADAADAWPVFYEVSDRRLPLYIDLGLTLLKIGEEAMVPLTNFSLDGGDRKGLRRTVRAMEKDGVQFEIVDAAAVPPLLPQLRDISDDWLRAKSAREKGFSLGRFDEQYLARFPHAVVRANDRIVAFANMWVGSGHELSIDLMRFASDAPPGAMEYMLIEVMLWGRANGFSRMNLGMAPLAGLEQRALAPMWNRIGGLVYRHGEDFYNFKGLRAYKEKFAPVWEPRYMASPAGLALPIILTNVASLISGGVMGVFKK